MKTTLQNLTTQNRSPQSRSLRGGFTLIELLVVMAIILVLAGMALRFADTSPAREAATQATLMKVSALLQERRTAFDRYVQKALKAADMKNSTTLGARKDAFKKAFPQTFSEAGLTGGGSHTADTESAEVLYWMLTESNVFGLPPVNTDQFIASEVDDTDKDGKPEFIDSWGRPLTFYRWPTRLIRPGGNGTAVRKDIVELLISGLRSDMLGQDPDDPLGRFSATMSETAYHTKNTYHTLLVVSAGADGELGLYEPRDPDPTHFGWLAKPISTTNPGDGPLNDNLTNRQAR